MIKIIWKTFLIGLWACWCELSLQRPFTEHVESLLTFAKYTQLAAKENITQRSMMGGRWEKNLMKSNLRGTWRETSSILNPGTGKYKLVWRKKKGTKKENKSCQYLEFPRKQCFSPLFPASCHIIHLKCFDLPPHRVISHHNLWTKRQIGSRSHMLAVRNGGGRGNLTRGSRLNKTKACSASKLNGTEGSGGQLTREDWWEVLILIGSEEALHQKFIWNIDRKNGRHCLYKASVLELMQREGS